MEPRLGRDPLADAGGETFAEMTVLSSECRSRDVASDLACVCGQSNLQDLGPCRPLGSTRRGSDYESDLSSQLDPGRLYRCPRCFLGLRLPRPDDEVIALLYQSMPATRWKEGAPAGSAQQQLINRLGKKADRRLRVLDIGAFDGSFLGALPSEFEKSAIEPSDAAAELAKQSIHVLKSFLEPATPSQAGQYDVVTMFDVFEHLADPIQGMKDAMSYVRPGGRLMVGTGNMDHWSWRTLRGSHWYLDPIQHVVIGSDQHFRWQADQLGASSYRSTTLSHQHGTPAQRLSQALTTVYFAAKDRPGLGSVLARVMNILPAYRRMSHKTAVPYTQQLHDHLLAEFVRSEVTL